MKYKKKKERKKKEERRKRGDKTIKHISVPLRENKYVYVLMM